MTYNFKLLKQRNDQAQLKKIKHLQLLDFLNSKLNSELEEEVTLKTKEMLAQKEELLEQTRLIADSINYAKRSRMLYTLL